MVTTISSRINASATAIAIAVGELAGTIHSVGADGPVYQVVRSIDGETLRILVVETGETLDYPMAQALEDPLAR